MKWYFFVYLYNWIWLILKHFDNWFVKSCLIWRGEFTKDIHICFLIQSRSVLLCKYLLVQICFNNETKFKLINSWLGLKTLVDKKNPSNKKFDRFPCILSCKNKLWDWKAWMSTYTTYLIMTYTQYLQLLALKKYYSKVSLLRPPEIKTTSLLRPLV